MWASIRDFIVENIELWKLAVSLLTPAVAAIFAIWVARAGILTDKRKSYNQELIKQRLEVYRTTAPLINEIYCFCSFIGPWQELTPQKVIQNKRIADRNIHVYRPIFSNQLFQSYQDLISLLFQEFNGFGETAKIRIDLNYAKVNWRGGWQPGWDNFVTKPFDDPLDVQYEKFMRAFGEELGAEAPKWALN